MRQAAVSTAAGDVIPGFPRVPEHCFGDDAIEPSHSFVPPWSEQK